MDHGNSSGGYDAILCKQFVVLVVHTGTVRCVKGRYDGILYRCVVMYMYAVV